MIGRRHARRLTRGIVGGVAALVLLAPAAAPADSPAPPSLWPKGMSLPVTHHGAWIARVTARTRAAEHAGGDLNVPFDEFTPVTRSPVRLLVLGYAGVTTNGETTGWVRVRLARRPNTADAWLPADRVDLVHTRSWIDVHLKSRSVRVYRDGRTVRRFRAVVGARATPTPTGIFAIYELAKQKDPSQFVGTWVLHLTAHSNVLENFGGGPGRTAIHGRAGASLNDPLGSARSHGCIRLSNAAVGWIAQHVSPGTPVRVLAR